jgi:hypothetical protein
MEEKGQDKLVRTKADILDVGEHLHFRSDTFKKGVSYHVIEHSTNPFLFLKELVRVSRGIIEIRCPHRFACYSKRPFHRSFLNLTWFIKALEKLKIKTYDLTVSYSPFLKLGPIALLQRINEIHVKIYKEEERDE